MRGLPNPAHRPFDPISRRSLTPTLKFRIYIKTIVAGSKYLHPQTSEFEPCIHQWSCLRISKPCTGATRSSVSELIHSWTRTAITSYFRHIEKVSHPPDAKKIFPTPLRLTAPLLRPMELTKWLDGSLHKRDACFGGNSLFCKRVDLRIRRWECWSLLLCWMSSYVPERAFSLFSISWDTNQAF